MAADYYVSMSKVSEDIQAASDRWMQGWVRGDANTLDESLAPDFALIVSATPEKRLDRASWLSTACSRYRASEFRYRDVQVRELGSELAVMSSVAEFTAEIDGAPRNGPLFIVDIWRRMDGRWRVCARYSSIPEEDNKSAEAVSSLS